VGAGDLADLARDVVAEFGDEGLVSFAAAFQGYEGDYGFADFGVGRETTADSATDSWSTRADSIS
jgi:hypothetical protein